MARPKPKMKDDPARGVYHTKGRCRCWKDGDAIYVASSCYVFSPRKATPQIIKVRKAIMALKAA